MNQRIGENIIFPSNQATDGRIKMLPDLKLDDHLRLRKAHPCGGFDWKVLRVGADIKIECITCNRQVMLTRRELAKRTRMVLPRDDELDQ